MVFFEAPHRLAVMLGAVREAFGGARRAAVCRELTKTYEEVVRGSLDELVAWAEGEVRGEITVVVEGGSPVVASLPEAVRAVGERVAAGSGSRTSVPRCPPRPD